MNWLMSWPRPPGAGGRSPPPAAAAAAAGAGAGPGALDVGSAPSDDGWGGTGWAEAGGEPEEGAPGAPFGGRPEPTALAGAGAASGVASAANMPGGGIAWIVGTPGAPPRVGPMVWAGSWTCQSRKRGQGAGSLSALCARLVERETQRRRGTHRRPKQAPHQDLHLLARRRRPAVGVEHDVEAEVGLAARDRRRGVRRGGRSVLCGGGRWCGGGIGQSERRASSRRRSVRGSVELGRRNGRGRGKGGGGDGAGARAPADTFWRAAARSA